MIFNYLIMCACEQDEVNNSRDLFFFFHEIEYAQHFIQSLSDLLKD